MTNSINVLLDRIDTDQQFPLGHEYNLPGGKKYRYIKYNEGAGVNAVAGGYLKPLDSNNKEWELTADADWSNRVIPARKGAFAQAAFTNGKFGWAQTKGENSVAGTIVSTVSEGGALMPHATTNNAVAALSGSFGTVAQVAVAKVAVSSGTTIAVGGMTITCEE